MPAEGAQACRDMRGGTEDRALLQDLLIRECGELRGLRGALGAFDTLRTPEIALPQAFVIGHDTGLGVLPCLLLCGSPHRSADAIALGPVRGGRQSARQPGKPQ